MSCVSSIQINKGSIKIKVGEWYDDLTATVTPNNACNKTLRWYSDNSNIASVNPNTGYICGMGVGTTTIYARSTDGSGVYDSCTVTVYKNVPVEKITLDMPDFVMQRDKSRKLTATISPVNATNKAVKWVSSNENILRVVNGTVCALSVGTATITARSEDNNSIEAYCNIQVTENVIVQNVYIREKDVILRPGGSTYLHKCVLPENATNQNVVWSSSNTNVVTVNPESGLVMAQGEGTAKVYATAADGGRAQTYIYVTVEPIVPVESVEICPTTLTLEVGKSVYMAKTVYPTDATDRRVTWSSSNPDVASIDCCSGYVTAKKAGTATITVTTVDGNYSSSCDLWAKGKTPVFLIHGRTSNSNGVWGINNNIPSGTNNGFESDINAVASNGNKYIDVDSQTLGAFEPNKGNSDTDCPCHLGNELISAGYKKNVNLFAFNYPNQDAVVHSAKKFEKYIENLIADVRTSGDDEKKACFYASKTDYDNNNYKINIVGHSMGGLVARYFIENLYQDNHVDKLITICTPHWGSGYGDFSNWTSIQHKLCDHDLDFDSIMFGGSNPNNYKFDENGCKILKNDLKCIDHAYELSNELQYSKSRNTRYYAIAGIDYPGGPIIQNDYWFEMSTNYTTYQQIDDFMVGKQVYRYAPSDFDPKSVGDNMVGFMSQIGWTENIGNTPNKKIPMEKIFIDIDTNGGNGGGVFIWEVVNGLGSKLFHNKAPHRTPVCNKVIEYLED